MIYLHILQYRKKNEWGTSLPMADYSDSFFERRNEREKKPESTSKVQ